MLSEDQIERQATGRREGTAPWKQSEASVSSFLWQSLARKQIYGNERINDH